MGDTDWDLIAHDSGVRKRDDGMGACFDPCLARKPLRFQPSDRARPKIPTDAAGKPLKMTNMPPRTPTTSRVPYLRERFFQTWIGDLAIEHDGQPETLSDEDASRRLASGWSASNDRKFAENEELCRTIFADNWDSRYGRSRVLSHQTGEMLCWGDGETYYDREPSTAPRQPLHAPRPLGQSGHYTQSGPLLWQQGAPGAATVDMLALRSSQALRRITSRMLPPAGSAAAQAAAPQHPSFPPPKMHVAHHVQQSLSQAAPSR